MRARRALRFFLDREEETIDSAPAVPGDDALEATHPAPADRTPTAPDTPPIDPNRGLHAGMTFGRFFLLNRLGGGGMGVVWAAYDPQLDRKVALKFVRADTLDQSPEYVLARFQREAQAMARVSHPNVIAVHDVGQTGEQVYIAEEFVRGVELTDWMKKPGHTQAQILDVMLQAARGLGAAHLAGIIHRDFKPANVLVGEDGRVRVVDFGLARATGDAPETMPVSMQSPVSTPLTSALTRPGASVGTPFYMAPEQYAGRTSEARGDQFGFCVSLFEALYGIRPFAAKNYFELSTKVCTGQMEPLPKGNRVPAYIREVVLRGLSTKEEDRFPSMQELIAALEKDPGAGKRNRIAVGLAALAMAGLFAFAAWQLHERNQLCHGGVEALASVWSSQKKSTAKAAFLATRLPFADHLWASVEKSLDGYGRDWVAMHKEACEVTRLRGEQSEDVLDLRMTCLAQHLQELQASAELFAKADRLVVEKSAQVASGLSPLSECADIAALQAPVRPPRDAQARAKVEEVRGRLAQAKADTQSAKYVDGLAIAQAAVASAASIGYLPLQAEALVAQGNLQALLRNDGPALQSLQDAFYSAESGRHDAVASKAALLLIDHVGRDLTRREEGLQWARLEASILARGAGSRDDEGSLHKQIGNLYDDQGKYPEARAELEKACAIFETPPVADPLSIAGCRSNLGLVMWHEQKFDEARKEFVTAQAIYEALLGPDHPLVGNVHNNLGLVLADEGNNEEALKELRLGLDNHRKTLGEDHPEVAQNHVNLAHVLGALNRLPEALAEYQRGLEIEEKSSGKESLDAGGTRASMGVIYLRMGAGAEALAQLRRGIEILEKIEGLEHPDVGDAYNNLGTVLGALGKNAESLAALRHGLAIHEKALGPDHPRVASDRSNVGSMLITENKPEEAMLELGKALPVQAKALGMENPATAFTEGNLGEAELKQKAYAKSIEHLTHAAAVLTEKAPDPAALGEFHFYLAQARWAANDDRARAVALAKQGRAQFAEAPGHEKEIAGIDAWLAAHHL